MGDGDGWVHCSSGHRHWGLFGAAGVLVTDLSHVLLAHRAAWTHQGGSWAVPGGALDSGETPTLAALRELGEETSLPAASVRPFADWVDDHGTWRYTTVLATVAHRDVVHPRRQLFHGRIVTESDDVRWWPLTEVAGLPLHSGFAAAWPTLHTLIADRAAAPGSADVLP